MSSNLSNSTTNNPTDGDGRLSDILEGIVIMFLAAIAIIGNGIIIFIIYKNRNLRALRNLFIASLALSDFCLAATDILYQGIDKLVPNYRPPHFSICYFILLCGVLFASASVFNLTAMTLNRYIAIIYPLHYSQYVTPRRSACILLLLWVFALCLAVPPLVWRPVGVVCYSTTPSKEHVINEIAYMVSEWLFWFVIPGFVILICYCRIYRIAKNQARQIAALEQSQRQAAEANEQALNSKVRISTYKERKAGRMVSVLIGFWLFCWLPFFVVLTIHKFHTTANVPPIVMSVCLTLMFINSAVNPILLTTYNREMKTALKSLYRKQSRNHNGPMSSVEVELTSVRRMTHANLQNRKKETK